MHGEYVANVLKQFEGSPENFPTVILMHEKEKTVNNLVHFLIYFKKKGYNLD